MRKLEDEHARQGKLQKQKETRAMYDKSIKVKNAKVAREMQEELAFDMKVLQKLLEETHNEALEEAQRKVRVTRSRSFVGEDCVMFLYSFYLEDIFLKTPLHMHRVLV